MKLVQKSLEKDNGGYLTLIPEEEVSIIIKGYPTHLLACQFQIKVFFVYTNNK
jgi:hypothetical protein